MWVNQPWSKYCCRQKLRGMVPGVLHLIITRLCWPVEFCTFITYANLKIGLHYLNFIFLPSRFYSFYRVSEKKVRFGIVLLNNHMEYVNNNHRSLFSLKRMYYDFIGQYFVFICVDLAAKYYFNHYKKMDIHILRLF